MDDDDAATARSLVDSAWNELDRQHLNHEGDGELYVDTVDGFIEGRPNMEKLALAILTAYWEEYGR
jgi:hypothetical protein